MKKVVFIFLIASLFVSCESKTIYKAPSDLIPKDTMKLVIEDLFIASAARNQKNKFMQNRIDYHPLIAEKYQIDSTRFARSSIYYTSQIDDYQLIIKEVQIRLKERRALLLEEKRKLDSIKKEEKTIMVKAYRDSVPPKKRR